MKTIKRFLLGVLFATFIFATCGMSVFAATNTKTLKQNTWFTQKDNGDITYNKITVAKDGYITITLENADKNSIWIDLYDKNKEYVGEPVYTSDKKVTVKYAVAKGTYYLKGRSYYNYKYKYTFTKAVNKTNYTASKALNLKANSEVVIVNTPMNGYDRWYKIKLTKKKAITYWRTGSSTINLYDSDFEQLDTLYDDEDDSYCTKKVLPKGTYYVRIREYNYYSARNRANIATFKWK